VLLRLIMFCNGAQNELIAVSAAVRPEGFMRAPGECVPAGTRLP
jgi:hypothetical protein